MTVICIGLRYSVTNARVCVRVCVSACMCECVRVYMLCVCMCVFLWMCVYICLCTFICLFLSVRAYVYMYVCMCVSVCSNLCGACLCHLYSSNIVMEQDVTKFRLFFRLLHLRKKCDGTRWSTLWLLLSHHVMRQDFANIVPWPRPVVLEINIIGRYCTMCMRVCICVWLHLCSCVMSFLYARLRVRVWIRVFARVYVCVCGCVNV